MFWITQTSHHCIRAFSLICCPLHIVIYGACFHFVLIESSFFFPVKLLPFVRSFSNGNCFSLAPEGRKTLVRGICCFIVLPSRNYFTIRQNYQLFLYFHVVLWISQCSNYQSYLVLQENDVWITLESILFFHGIILFFRRREKISNPAFPQILPFLQMCLAHWF